MARLRRVHHPALPGEAGARIDLTREEARHVCRVLRLRAGEAIAVFDGKGSEWRGTIETSGPGGVAVRLVEPIETVVEPPRELVLFQALVKPERVEWLLQKTTEIGVSGVVLFPGSRGEQGAPSDRRLDRWRRILVEACKQSGRRRVPRLEVGGALPAPAPGSLALLLDPAAPAPPLADFFPKEGPSSGPVWLAVGPEGGFAPEEVRAGVEAGWRAAGLGPRILRAETAGVVAAAIVLHRMGDLGAAGGPASAC